MRVQLLDPTKSYKPITDRAEAEKYLESEAGGKEVILRILPNDEGWSLATHVSNSDALVGTTLRNSHIGISSPGIGDWFHVNQFPFPQQFLRQVLANKELTARHDLS